MCGSSKKMEDKWSSHVLTNKQEVMSHEAKHCEDLDWMFMFDSEKLEDNSGQDGWWHSWLQNAASHVGHLLA